MTVRFGVMNSASAVPAIAPWTTGVLSSEIRNARVACGTWSTLLVRPSSSARPLVCCSENSGWPVTAVSRATQISGPAAV